MIFTMSMPILFSIILLFGMSSIYVNGFTIRRLTKVRSIHVVMDMSSEEEDAQQQQQQRNKQRTTSKRSFGQQTKLITIGDLRQNMIERPTQYQNEIRTKVKSTIDVNIKSSKRTRKRVDNPQQQYVYAAQKRKQLEIEEGQGQDGGDVGNRVGNALSVPKNRMYDIMQQKKQKQQQELQDQVNALTKELNLLPSTQHCDPIIYNYYSNSNSNSAVTSSSYSSSLSSSNTIVPKIIARIQVGSTNSDNTDSSSTNMYAYIIDKPYGWSIIGEKRKTNYKKNPTIQQTQLITNDNNNDDDDDEPKLAHNVDEIAIVDKDDDDNNTNDDSTTNVNTVNTIKNTKSFNTKKIVKVVDEEDGSLDTLEYNEMDVIALLTPEELEEYMLEEGLTKLPSSSSSSATATGTTTRDDSDSTTTDISSYVTPIRNDEETLANIKRIETRLQQMKKSNDNVNNNGNDNNDDENEEMYVRPSIMTWLKSTLRNEQSIMIRGGNYWTGLAGATSIDDSGLVLVCPKVNTNNIYCNALNYTAIVGTGGYIASSIESTAGTSTTSSDVQIDIVSKLVKNRIDDPIYCVNVYIPDSKSTCTSIVQYCQNYNSYDHAYYLSQGIRGDPYANPFDRRSHRRLIHCTSMSVSSTTSDDYISTTSLSLPDDMTIYTDRAFSSSSSNSNNNNAVPTFTSKKRRFSKGSYIGRQQSLQENSMTTAYREINGAADGYPGWIIDRYDRWLLISHDPEYPKGPIPSIHDGYTVGVYYIQSIQDRSKMGTTPNEYGNRPILLEGKAAPEVFPIKENGISYLVSLHRDLSTGIFLDQRYHRAWLQRYCTKDTKVLNCFAHTGAYSVAAASAGAMTVNIDISKIWLNRFWEQLDYNTINHSNHDTIDGDCFDWLQRLIKRKEQYDIVILDPPSTSISTTGTNVLLADGTISKKKRWSVQQDMDTLVNLAVQLVKPNGYLWTTTNSNSISSMKFAKLCYKGLVINNDSSSSSSTSSSSSRSSNNNIQQQQIKLERIQPMPYDFPSIGSHPVKNLVWKIPPSSLNNNKQTTITTTNHVSSSSPKKSKATTKTTTIKTKTLPIKKQ